MLGGDLATREWLVGALIGIQGGIGWRLLARNAEIADAAAFRLLRLHRGAGALTEQHEFQCKRLVGVFLRRGCGLVTVDAARSLTTTAAVAASPRLRTVGVLRRRASRVGLLGILIAVVTSVRPRLLLIATELLRLWRAVLCLLPPVL